MEKVFVTPDIAPQFKQVMKSLTLFDKIEVVFLSEMMGKEYDTNSLIQQITEYAPTLIITRSQEITSYFSTWSNQCKIVSLANCEKDCDRLFLSNALTLNAFMCSKAKTFELK